MNYTIDIIIVNYNSTHVAIRCIDNIKRSIGFIQSRIIVVDNCSKDSPVLIKRVHPDIELVINPCNEGFAWAVNFALRRSKGKYVVFLNPDAFIYNGFFDTIFDYLEHHPDTAIAAPMVIERNGSVQGSARRFPTPWTSLFGRRSPITRLFPNNSITRREFPCFGMKRLEPLAVDWVSGACMVARTVAVKAVGGFDDRFFMYWEDADLCRRLRAKGWEIVYYPKARIYHYTGFSSDTAPLTSIFHFHRSCIVFLRKYSNSSMKVLMSFILIGLSLRCMVAMAKNRLLWIITK